MLYRKEDGTFGDTHELTTKEFDADEIVDNFVEDYETYELFKEKVEFEWIDRRCLDIFKTPKSYEFYEELEFFAEDELDRELEPEEIEELHDSWDLEYKLVLNKWSEMAIESKVQDYEDYDPY